MVTNGAKCPRRTFAIILVAIVALKELEMTIINVTMQILENLPFGQINQSDVIIHISEEKEAFSVKLHSKKL